MYRRGDLVRVVGYGGQVGVLRVWKVGKRGLGLCTDDGFQRLMNNEEAAVVGFPQADIQGVIENTDPIMDGAISST